MNITRHALEKLEERNVYDSNFTKGEIIQDIRKNLKTKIIIVWK